LTEGGFLSFSKSGCSRINILNASFESYLNINLIICIALQPVNGFPNR